MRKPHVQTIPARTDDPRHHVYRRSDFRVYRRTPVMKPREQNFQPAFPKAISQEPSVQVHTGLCPVATCCVQLVIDLIQSFSSYSGVLRKYLVVRLGQKQCPKAGGIATGIPTLESKKVSTSEELSLATSRCTHRS